MVDNTDQLWRNCPWIRETRASILNTAPSLPFATSRMAALISWIQSFIHSSEAWWMIMNIISSCAPVRSFWQASNLSSDR
jgi:hypothetical protein